MNAKGVIIGLNLLVLLIYNVLVHVILFEGGSHRDLGIMIYLAMLIAIHVMVALVTGVILRANDQKPKGNAFLISAGIVLLVGFSTCLGTPMLLEGFN